MSGVGYDMVCDPIRPWYLLPLLPFGEVDPAGWLQGGFAILEPLVKPLVTSGERMNHIAAVPFSRIIGNCTVGAKHPAAVANIQRMKYAKVNKYTNRG